MKRKLTLTIDKKNVVNAKEYAKAKKISISKLVSNYLATLNSGVKLTPYNELSPRLKKMAGAFKVPEKLEVDYLKQMGEDRSGTQSPRKGWRNAFKKMAKNNDDKLLMPDVFEDE